MVYYECSSGCGRVGEMQVVMSNRLAAHAMSHINLHLAAASKIYSSKIGYKCTIVISDARWHPSCNVKR
jgi:hypothetical protein